MIVHNCFRNFKKFNNFALFTLACVESNKIYEDTNAPTQAQTMNYHFLINAPTQAQTMNYHFLIVSWYVTFTTLYNEFGLFELL